MHAAVVAGHSAAVACGSVRLGARARVADRPPPTQANARAGWATSVMGWRVSRQTLGTRRRYVRLLVARAAVEGESESEKESKEAVSALGRTASEGIARLSAYIVDVTCPPVQFNERCFAPAPAHNPWRRFADSGLVLRVSSSMTWTVECRI